MLDTFPTDELGRLLIPASAINIEGRLRQVFINIDELAEDIALNGLIQPVVIMRDLKLVDGHRRFKALTEVLKRDVIPCVYKDSDSATHHKIMEIMANVAREDFTWQERVLGIVEVHELTLRDRNTNREKWTREQTAALFKVSRSTVNNAVWLAECIRAGDTEIIKAEGVREAVAILVKRAEDAATKKLAIATLGNKPKSSVKITPITRLETTAVSDMPSEDDGFVRGPSARKDFSQLNVQTSNDEDPDGLATEELVPLSRMFFNADCIDFGSSLPTGSVDHIITDIPYGINMDYLTNVDTVRAEHDVDENVALYHRMFPMFQHVLRDKGFCVMWYDLDHHQLLQDLARKYGFTPQRWPLIWCKTDTCKNDAAGQNFTKNFEVAMVLRKGNATLVTPQQSSYFYCSADRIGRQVGHPFAKPLELWRWIFSATTLIGQTIFDPFAGVGTCSMAAVEQGLRPLGCELVEDHYHKLIVNMSNKYRQVIRNVRFE